MCQEFKSIPPKGGLLSPTKHQRVSSKWLGVLSYFFRTFLSSQLSFRKFSSITQPSCMLPWQPYNWKIWHIFQTHFSIVSETFPSLTSLIYIWEFFLCLGNRPISQKSTQSCSGSFTLGIFQRITLPKYGYHHQVNLWVPSSRAFTRVTISIFTPGNSGNSGILWRALSAFTYLTFLLNWVV